MNSRMRTRLLGVAKKLSSINIESNSNSELIVRKLDQHINELKSNLNAIKSSGYDGVNIQSQGLLKRALRSMSDANDALWQYARMRSASGSLTPEDMDMALSAYEDGRGWDVTISNKDNPKWGRWTVIEKVTHDGSTWWYISGDRGERAIYPGELGSWVLDTPKTSSNTVNDSIYTRNHGASPRGIGNWAFTFGVKDPLNDDIWFAPGPISYSDAKDAAKAEARSRGFNGIIYLMP